MIIRRAVLAALAVTALALGLAWTGGPASAATSRPAAPAAASSNPLANLTWGNYDGPQDEVFPAYNAATGENKVLIGKVALRPRVRWFGAWYSNSVIAKTVHDYIANVTKGKTNVLVQMAVFRLAPGESEACKRLPTAAEQASYKQWINAFAGALGSTHVALILQPDLPVWSCAPHGSKLPEQLVDYAVGKFAAHPNTHVYIDAGAADWKTVAQAVSILRSAGVARVRGFALDATHYDSTYNQINYGVKIVRALADAGIHDKRFVINTADTGHPFTHAQFLAEHPGGDFNNAPTCTKVGQSHCVALGIAPTWHVSATWTKVPVSARRLALVYVDAYLWYGRPWLTDQSGAFNLARTLNMARTSPF